MTALTLLVNVRVAARKRLLSFAALSGNRARARLEELRRYQTPGKFVVSAIIADSAARGQLLMGRLAFLRATVSQPETGRPGKALVCTERGRVRRRPRRFAAAPVGVRLPGVAYGRTEETNGHMLMMRGVAR